MSSLAKPFSGHGPNLIKIEPLRQPRHDGIGDEHAPFAILRPVNTDVVLTVRINMRESIAACCQREDRCQDIDLRPQAQFILDPNRVGFLS